MPNPIIAAALRRFLRQCLICSALLAAVMLASVLNNGLSARAASYLNTRLTAETDWAALRAFLRLDPEPTAPTDNAAAAPPPTQPSLQPSEDTPDPADPTDRVRIDPNILFNFSNP